MGRKRIVYVSSTFVDLELHRAVLKVELERAGFDVESMERYPAFDERPLDRCLRDVAACDVFMLVVGRRYGFIPYVHGIKDRSITELEYEHASLLCKPRLVFCIDESHPWPVNYVDSPRTRVGRRLNALRGRILEEHGVRTFTEPDNLAKQALAALSALMLPSHYTWRTPWDFNGYISQKRVAFEGRDWLLAEIVAWREAGRPGAMLLRADFGVGKSAFMAELVHRNPGGAIAAWHFCQHDTQETLQAGTFVLSIAAQLAISLPSYRALVDAEPNLQEHLDRAATDPGSALEGAVLSPLARLPAPATSLILLVDALDEALEVDLATTRTTCNIVALLAAKAGRFPPWLLLLATSRPDPRVLVPLQRAFVIKEVDAESAVNSVDLYQYVIRRANCEPMLTRLRKSEVDAEVFAAQVSKQSQGKFLYAVQAMRDIEVGRLGLGDLAGLPPGMDSFYLDAFERRYSRDGLDFEDSRRVLGVMAVAREPMPASAIAQVLDIDLSKVKAVHRLLPSFLHMRLGRLGFEHFSLAEWLTQENGEGFARAGDYAVDSISSQERLRTWAVAEVSAGRAHRSEYLLRYLASHLRDATERRKIFGELMLTAFEWLQARFDQGGVAALIADTGYLDGLPEKLLLQAMLRNAAHILRIHLDQLASQLLGRIGMGLGDSRMLGALAESARFYLNRPVDIQRAHPVLVPTTRSLRLSSALAAACQGGGGAMAVLPDGRIALGGFDGNILLWHPRSEIELVTLSGHSGQVTALAVLPDGRLASSSTDRTVRVWDISRMVGVEVLEGHSSSVSVLAVVPDGRVASGSDDGTVRIWGKQQTDAVVICKGHTDGVTVLTVMHDAVIASGSQDYTVRLWDTGTGAQLAIFKESSGAITDLKVLSNGKLASASGADDCKVRVWDPQCAAGVQVFEGHYLPINALVVLRDGSIASGSDDGSIFRWMPHRNVEYEAHEHTKGQVTALLVLPDGRLVSGHGDGSVRLRDLVRGRKAVMLGGHSKEVTSLVGLSDGCFASGSNDGTVRLWDPIGSELDFEIDCHSEFPTVIESLPDGRTVSGSADGTVCVWNPENGAKEVSFDSNAPRVNALAVLPDGRVAVGLNDLFVQVWDPRQIVATISLGRHSSYVLALAVLLDGRLASCSEDKTVRVWNLHEPFNSVVLRGHIRPVNVLTVLPDGRLVSGAMDCTVRVWETPFDKAPLTFDGFPSGITALAVLAEGIIVSGDSSGAICVLNLGFREIPVEIGRHSQEVTDLTVLQDGRVASRSQDGSVRVWDLQSGGYIVVFDGVSSRVHALTTLSDGRMAAGFNDGTVRVWDPLGKRKLSLFASEGSVTCIAGAPNGLVVVGCHGGAMHFLREVGADT